METNSTPLKPTKKRPKGRVDKIDSFDDSFSSTNSSRSGATITATIDINDENNESQLLRPVRTGRAKQPANYVSISQPADQIFDTSHRTNDKRISEY